MFDNKFEVFLCDTFESKMINFALRYKVYCVETEYEDPSSFPEQVEYDEYDSNSVHFIVRKKGSHDWIAGMRLVLDLPHRLPCYKHSAFDQPEKYSAHVTGAEISRLCIVSDFRRKQAGSVSCLGDTVVELSQRRPDPMVVLGLMRAADHYCKENEIPYLFGLQANSLARILKSVGFQIEPVGQVCNFRGERRPYVSESLTFAENLKEHKNENIAAMFRAESGYHCYSQQVFARSGERGARKAWG